jgi:hypothetical protein
LSNTVPVWEEKQSDYFFGLPRQQSVLIAAMQIISIKTHGHKPEKPPHSKKTQIFRHFRTPKIFGIQEMSKKNI